MADGRFYEFDGDPRKYVSVTTFLGIIGKQQFLMPWAAKYERELILKLYDNGHDLAGILDYIKPIKDEKTGRWKQQPYGYQLYMEETSEWGSTIHKAIDYTLKDLKLPKMTKAQRKVYDKWKEWWKAQSYELVGAEKVVKSEKYGYAGTMDAEVISEGKRLILDWKTGKNHYRENDLQNLAYQRALPAEGESLPGGGLLVYIPREKEIDDSHKIPQVTPELMQPVLDALSLWRWANNKPWKEAA